LTNALPVNRSANSRQLMTIAERAYALIGQSFPVCCYSDEFYFFPQLVVDDPQRWLWDDFSAAKVASLASALAGLEAELARLSTDLLDDDATDVTLLLQTLSTLREHLTQVAPQRSQPTFHLTVLAAGLAEALLAGDEAWSARSAGVPAFLQRAVACLEEVSREFHQLGLQMLGDIQAWVDDLGSTGFSTQPIAAALDQFGAALQKITPRGDYRLPPTVYARLVAQHLDCQMDLDGLRNLLQDELTTMREILAEETARLLPGKDWLQAVRDIPFVVAEDGDLRTLYRQTLQALEDHCRDVGLLPDTLPASVPLETRNVPACMTAIRASDAYAAIPGTPPRGGVFYVVQQGRDPAGRLGRSLEFRMTAAHEAWPGHHLLDACRWALPRSLRHPLEQPLFYEGWACLAEEIMLRTGFFSDPWDRFLLAKRRAERAGRGLVDLGLQGGDLNTQQAVVILTGVGYTPEQAKAVIPKYLLRPGYQICYTLGLQQGLQLLDRFAGNDLGGFAKTVLQQGEIGFARLTGKFLTQHERRGL
jgi:hypothetical protein